MKKSILTISLFFCFNAMFSQEYNSTENSESYSENTQQKKYGFQEYKAFEDFHNLQEPQSTGKKRYIPLSDLLGNKKSANEQSFFNTEEFYDNIGKTMTQSLDQELLKQEEQRKKEKELEEAFNNDITNYYSQSGTGAIPANEYNAIAQQHSKQQVLPIVKQSVYPDSELRVKNNISIFEALFQGFGNTIISILFITLIIGVLRILLSKNKSDNQFKNNQNMVNFRDKIIRLGKISNFIDYFFSYGIILFFLYAVIASLSADERYITNGFIDLKSAGITAMIGIIIFKYIKDILPFGLSVYNNLKELLQQKINFKSFRLKLIIKTIINILILPFFLLLSHVVINEWFIFNNDDKILFVIIGIIPALFLIYHLCYFYLVYRFVSRYKTTFSQTSLSMVNNILAKDNSIENSQNEPAETQNVDIGSIEKQDKINYKRLVKNKLTSLKQALKNSNVINRISKKIKTLNYSEIIIVSVAVGAIFFLILGYGFADKERFVYHKGEKYYLSKDVIYSDMETITKLNYGLAFPGFIITAGICYLFLNSKKKSQNDNKGSNEN